MLEGFTKVNVLDHGFVRLVAYTQPISKTDTWSADLEVVRNARVSYDAEWRSGDDAGADAKLINYLMKNRHSSPFEAVSLTFEVKAPIFVLRQWHRHRTWSYNELSARYRELPEEFFVPELSSITTQSADNKQMRTGEQNEHAQIIQSCIEQQHGAAFKMYRHLLGQGCPRELARSVLPLGTYSHMFATVNLLNLFKFLELRLHEHAQQEIRVYAEAMVKMAKSVAPVSTQAFVKHVLKEEL